MLSLRRLTAFPWRCAVIAVIATGLLTSPWLPLGEGDAGVGFDTEQSISSLTAWHAALVGGILAFTTIVHLVRRTAWLAGVQLIIGLWIVMAPWVIDLDAGKAMLWVYGAAGLIVVALASFEIYREFRRESDIIEHMS